MSISVITTSRKLKEFAENAAQSVINKWKEECFDKLCNFDFDQEVQMDVEVPEEFQSDDTMHILQLLCDNYFTGKCHSLNCIMGKMEFSAGCMYEDNTLCLTFALIEKKR